MTLRLSKSDVDELMRISGNDWFETTYKGLNVRISPDVYGQIEINGKRFEVKFAYPNDVKVVISKD